jgi:hypothetical protein
MKEDYELVVQGRQHQWIFNITANAQDVEDWLADGLEVHMILHQIPTWYKFAGLPLGLWMFLEDAVKWLGKLLPF